MNRNDWEVDLDALAKAVADDDQDKIESLVDAAQKLALIEFLEVQGQFMDPISMRTITQELIDTLTEKHPASRRGLFLYLTSYGYTATIPDQYKPLRDRRLYGRKCVLSASRIHCCWPAIFGL